MARKESPENHLAAMATVAAIALVLVQTFTDRVPSRTHLYETRVSSEPSCTRLMGRAIVIGAPSAAGVTRNCLQRRTTRSDQLGHR
jgi:hypothetical protein